MKRDLFWTIFANSYCEAMIFAWKICKKICQYHFYSLANLLNLELYRFMYVV